MVAILSWMALSLLIGCSLPENSMAATSAYAHTTKGLDLNRVQFIILTPPELSPRLSERARSLFAKARLPLPESTGQDGRFIATLTLTLAPQPLRDNCPGHLLYAPSLTLTEHVLIPRNSAIMQNVTWLAHPGAQVRESVTVTDLEHDLEEFINQFIADYQAANAGSRTSTPGATLATPHPDTATAALEILPSDSTLDALRIDQLQISVSAGRFSQALRTRALQQLNDAGLALSPGPHHNGQLTLGVELIQQPLDDRCPGKVLYETGLYLVEQTQLTRNPRASIWSDTWQRETTQVVSPRSRKQLESDQDALLQQFIHALHRD